MADSNNKKSNKLQTVNEEREITGRQKVVRGSNIPVLTSHAGQNPRSKSGYEREARVIKKIETADEKSATYLKHEKALEEGKIHICQIPFKYRDAWAYARAMEYIKTRKEIEKKIEKEVVRIQLLNDITESKRKGDVERETDLMAAYETYFICGDDGYPFSTLKSKQYWWRKGKGVKED